MSVAIFSNVHGNLHALQAVLQHAREQYINTFYNLGNLIGLGPRPDDTITLAREVCKINLKGDMELQVTSSKILGGIHFKKAIEYNISKIEALDTSTKQRSLSALIKPGSSKQAGTLENWLRKLPDQKQAKIGMVAFKPPSWGHHHELHGYSLIAGIHDRHFRTIEEDNELQIWASRFDTRCFTGSFQLPGVLEFTEGAVRWLCPSNSSLPDMFTDSDHVTIMEGNTYNGGAKAIISVGSVGRPMDGDSRACYLTIAKGVVQWHKVEYDVESTIKEITDCPYLCSKFADRLRLGQG